MAYISFNNKDFFAPKLYTGTGGGTQAQTGLGFATDMTWIKDRSSDTYGHILTDSVRGDTKYLSPNEPDAQGTSSTYITSLDADGFTVGSAVEVGKSGDNYVSWNWKMGTTSGITAGTITPTSYSISATAKQGIYTWTGTGANGTIAHGLGVKPDLIIFKGIASSQWSVYSKASGATKALVFDTTAAEDTSSNFFNNTEPTDTHFTVGTNGQLNNSGDTFIAYVFCNVNGYFRTGKYYGNGNGGTTNAVDAQGGTFVHTGGKPAFLWTKRLTTTSNWYLYDNKRVGFNRKNYALFGASPSIEHTADRIVLLSNGFKFQSSDSDYNGSGNAYAYMCWMGEPLVSNNGTCGVAK